jgi:TPR repeat protein
MDSSAVSHPPTEMKAQYNYRRTLADGDGVDRNEDETIRSLRMAGDQHHAGGEVKYSYQVAGGRRVENNEAEAV